MGAEIESCLALNVSHEDHLVGDAEYVTVLAIGTVSFCAVDNPCCMFLEMKVRLQVLLMDFEYLML